MSYELVEAIATGTQDYIETNIAAKAAAVDARYSASAGLTTFGAVTVADPDDEQTPLDQYPKLWVAPSRSELDPGTGGISRGFSAEHTFELVLIDYHAGTATLSPPEMLKIRLMRYAVCLVELLAECHDVTLRPWHWGTGRNIEIEYAYTPGRKPGQYLGFVLIRAACEVTETNT